MRRQLLISAIAIMSIIGIAAIFTPFLLSLGISQKAEAARSSYDITSLNTGEYIMVDSHTSSEKILIIKDWDQTIYSYLIPAEADKVLMPDFYRWGSGFYKCSDFRPDLDQNNKIANNGSIRCHDTDTPKRDSAAWAWAYTGKKRAANTVWLPDLIDPKHEVKSGYIYINR